MKKIVLLVICLMMFLGSYGQLKEINLMNVDLKIKEKYTVIKGDKRIRQGPYEKYINIPQLNQKNLIEKGQYVNNKKVGLWTYYDEKGNVSLQYNFDKDSVIVYNGIQMDGLKQARPLLYLGSKDEITHITRWGVKIPIEAYNLRQSGTVLVELHITEIGEVSEYTIKNGVNKSLDSEAVRVARLIPISWLPPIKDGARFSYIYTFSITFVIY